MKLSVKWRDSNEKYLSTGEETEANCDSTFLGSHTEVLNSFIFSRVKTANLGFFPLLYAIDCIHDSGTESVKASRWIADYSSSPPEQFGMQLSVAKIDVQHFTSFEIQDKTTLS